MIIETTRRIGVTEVTPAFDMKLGALFRLLQDAAVTHSERVGLDSRALVNGGRVWLLNRIAIAVERLPRYAETVRVATWHRGSKGFRAYRDFEVTAGGRRLAAATSRWLLFDTARRRLQKVSPGHQHVVLSEALMLMAANSAKETNVSPSAVHNPYAAICIQFAIGLGLFLGRHGVTLEVEMKKLSETEILSLKKKFLNE